MSIMESRRFKIGRKEEEEILAEKGRCQDVAHEYIESVFEKLRLHHVKIETVLVACESIDRNKDGVIHADDLIDAISDLLPRKTISRREYHYLIEALGKYKGNNSKNKNDVKYMKLETLYNEYKWQGQEEVKERWHEDAYDDEFSGPKGSIGDFLNRSACPAEVNNYKILIACLEKYERETGMRISTNEEGFRIPLGPDLKAFVAFDTNPHRL